MALYWRFELEGGSRYIRSTEARPRVLHDCQPFETVVEAVHAVIVPRMKASKAISLLRELYLKQASHDVRRPGMAACSSDGASTYLARFKRLQKRAMVFVWACPSA